MQQYQAVLTDPQSLQAPSKLFMRPFCLPIFACTVKSSHIPRSFKVATLLEHLLQHSSCNKQQLWPKSFLPKQPINTGRCSKCSLQFLLKTINHSLHNTTSNLFLATNSWRLGQIMASHHTQLTVHVRMLHKSLGQTQLFFLGHTGGGGLHVGGWGLVGREGSRRWARQIGLGTTQTWHATATARIASLSGAFSLLVPYQFVRTHKNPVSAAAAEVAYTFNAAIILACKQTHTKKQDAKFEERAIIISRDSSHAYSVKKNKTK